MIYSRTQQPKDVAEQAQLALYNFYAAANKLSKEHGFGGLHHLTICVMDGEFRVEWQHEMPGSDVCQKIEPWGNLSFIPQGSNANPL